MKTAVIIQARVDSSRFPRKVLQLIEGKPMLWHVIERTKKMNLPVIVATTNRPIDDPLVQISKECDVEYYRGSTKDVLDRYYQAAKKFSLNIIIRITADCPLIDPRQSLKVVKLLNEKKADYVTFDESYPDGIDTECFNFSSLEKAWKNAKLKSQREHVTPYIRDQLKGCKILRLSSPINYNRFRWSVDYPDDLEFVRAIFSELGKDEIFHMEDIINLLKQKPNIFKINSLHERNEGYQKSLKEDGLF